MNNGGVWNATDAGRVWKPIFDEQPTGSIGALAVSPSNPEVIYVGSGEGLQRPDLSTGDGVYVSRDGGKSWTNTGLRECHQVSAVIVDPKDDRRAFVAVLGHPYSANEERGVFRTLDGGKNWKKVLYVGNIALCERGQSGSVTTRHTRLCYWPGGPEHQSAGLEIFAPFGGAAFSGGTLNGQ